MKTAESVKSCKISVKVPAGSDSNARGQLQAEIAANKNRNISVDNDFEKYGNQ